MLKYYSTVLKKYAVFQGRASRSEYWYFVLVNFIITIVLLLLGNAIHLPILRVLYALATLVPSVAVAIRRMHDVGKSGWFCIIPIYNLVLACTPGTVGDNQYGPDPWANGPNFEFDQEPAQ